MEGVLPSAYSTIEEATMEDRKQVVIQTKYWRAAKIAAARRESTIRAVVEEAVERELDVNAGEEA